MVKIELERVDIQKEITVEALLDSRATELVMSAKFARKHELNLKRLKKSILCEKHRQHI